MKKLLAIVLVSMLLMIATSAGATDKKEKTTDTLELKQGYRLLLDEVDQDGDIAKLHLTKANGDIIDSVTVSDDDGFSLYDEDILIIEVEKITVFIGIECRAVALNELVQYNKVNEKIILEIDKTLLITPNN